MPLRGHKIVCIAIPIAVLVAFCLSEWIQRKNLPRPADDFYGYISRQQALLSKAPSSSIRELLQTTPPHSPLIKQLAALPDCHNLRPFLDDLVSKARSKEQLLGRLSKSGVPVFVAADANYRNRTDPMIAALYPAASLPHQYYEVPRYRVLFRAFVQTLSDAVGWRLSKRELDTIVAIELEVGAICPTLRQHVQCRGRAGTDVAALNGSATPAFNWQEYLSEASISPAERLNAWTAEYVEAVAGIIGRLSFDELELYARWRIVAVFGGIANKAASEAIDTFAVGIGSHVGRGIDGKLADLIDPCSPGARTSIAFRSVQARDIDAVQKIADEILTVAIERAAQLPDPIRTRAIAKLRAIDIVPLRCFAAITDTGQLPSSNERIRAACQCVTTTVEGRRRMIDHCTAFSWQAVAPCDRNAWYSAEHNQVVFELGYIAGWNGWWFRHADDAQQYATVGVVYGHEISHAVCGRNIDFDEHGDYRPITQGCESLRVRDAALSHEIEAWPVGGKPPESGDTKIEETLAEIGGVALAVTAFERHLTMQRHAAGTSALREQLAMFFEQYARRYVSDPSAATLRYWDATDPHPAPRTRVNVVLSHIPEFRSVYAVEPGPRMAGGIIRDIWPPCQSSSTW